MRRRCGVRSFPSRNFLALVVQGLSSKSLVWGSYNQRSCRIAVHCKPLGGDSQEALQHSPQPWPKERQGPPSRTACHRWCESCASSMPDERTISQIRVPARRRPVMAHTRGSQIASAATETAYPRPDAEFESV